MDEICSWRDLDEAVAEANAAAAHDDHAHASLVFRGLSRASYTNESSLSRMGGDFARLEPHLIRNFRKYAHRERPGPALWDWLSLAQHHGLPTRLLDWTFSPFVAAHFATATAPDEDAVVWAVDCAGAHRLLPAGLRDAIEEEGATVFTTELLARHAPTLDDLDGCSEGEPFVVFFEPPSLDDRIVNQSAVLSVLSDPEASFDAWLDEHDDLWHRWRITAGAKREIRERLDQGGVTERVLMPGLDGLAAWLRRYYAPGGGPLAVSGDRLASGTGQGEVDQA